MMKNNFDNYTNYTYIVPIKFSRDSQSFLLLTSSFLNTIQILFLNLLTLYLGMPSQRAHLRIYKLYSLLPNMIYNYLIYFMLLP